MKPLRDCLGTKGLAGDTAFIKFSSSELLNSMHCGRAAAQPSHF